LISISREVPGVGNQADHLWRVFTALINRSSPNADFAQRFSKNLCTADGLKTIDSERRWAFPL
jgi:hypothetical protein